MKLAALFSGGKDSTLSVFKAIKLGHNVSHLISIVPENPESYMFHYPNINFTKLQSEAAEIPLMMKKTKGEKEKELKDLENVLSSIKDDIDGLVTGAIASRYQYERIKKLCEGMNLKLLSPLWGIKPETMWNELLKNDFEVIITSVSCEGLGKELLGRRITKVNFNELKKLSSIHKFHLSGEGGEFESFVTDCPIFRKKIEIEESETVWDSKSESGYFIIKKAVLKSKNTVW